MSRAYLERRPTSSRHEWVAALGSYEASPSCSSGVFKVVSHCHVIFCIDVMKTTSSTPSGE